MAHFVMVYWPLRPLLSSRSLTLASTAVDVAMPEPQATTIFFMDGFLSCQPCAVAPLTTPPPGRATGLSPLVAAIVNGLNIQVQIVLFQMVYILQRTVNTCSFARYQIPNLFTAKMQVN